MPIVVTAPNQPRAGAVTQADRECHSMTGVVTTSANQGKAVKEEKGSLCHPMTKTSDSPCHSVPIDVRLSRLSRLSSATRAHRHPLGPQGAVPGVANRCHGASPDACRRWNPG